MDSPTRTSIWSFAPTPTVPKSATPSTAMVMSRSGSTALTGLGRSLSVQAPTVTPASDPVLITTLDASSWRPHYPVIGQFAMTTSEEVVAAGPNGLFSFKRVRDHVSRPWSQPRPFPDPPFDSLSVSGIAIYENERSGRLDVFCNANSNLYSFSRSTKIEDTKIPPSFVADPSPPLVTYRVSGTPCIADMREASFDSSEERYSLVVPSQSGGLLHTFITGPKIQRGSLYSTHTKTEWEPVDHVATHLGIISAVTVVAFDTHKNSSFGPYYDLQVNIVAICGRNRVGIILF